MGDSILSYDTLVRAVSGAVGSVTAACITMPLTTAFTRLQLEDRRKTTGPLTTMIELVRDEGLLTLYRGCQSTLISISVSNFVYFYSFHGLKKWSGGDSQTAVKDLLFACTAGQCLIVTQLLDIYSGKYRVYQRSPHKPTLGGQLSSQDGRNSEGCSNLSWNTGRPH